MSSGRPPAGFPDAEAKLAKPIKQSAFERSKAEAEAKRKRDEAETAAVYEEFVKSFDHDEDDDAPSGRHAAPQHPRHGFGGLPSGPNTSKRHFAMSNMRKSGPGSLGPVPSSYGAKRSYNDFSGGSGVRDFLPGQEEHQDGLTSVSTKLNHVSDDENALQREAIERAELKAIAKPQLRLSNMPPGVSPAAIKALIPDTLTVDAVKIEPPTGPSCERRCTNAVVTLSRDSLGGAIEAAVSSLQNRYLGYGYYLSAHRHLSSAVLNPVSAPIPSSSAAQPFGAKLMEAKVGPQKHGSNRGFAPPSSYSHASSAANLTDPFYVPVKPPEDIRVVRMIHMVVERVLKDGPEFEALLMSRPEVQHEEKWAWLWDSKSVGGVWYRWRLWELATGYQSNPRKEPFVYLFEDSAPWQVPDPLPFEFVSEFDELASHPDYDSSDDEEMDRDGNGDISAVEVETPFLNPLEKAKLVHLLARLPTSHTKLRRGDVARVTAFALEHADRGPGEVVDLIISNIARPFAFTNANPNRNNDMKEAQQATNTEEGFANEAPDTSGGSLIGLYLVSDILSSSSTTAFRHSWRFRGLFEKALRDCQVFDFLGTMPDKQGWGRLRAEKWKRSISLVLNLWEGWCVFPSKTQEGFTSAFENPPSLKVEEKPSGETLDRSKWKSLTAKSTSAGDASPGQGDGQAGAADAEDGVTGEAVKDDDVEGEPITEDDVEGEPITEDDVEGEPISDTEMQSDDGDERMYQDDHESRDDGDIGEASGGSGQGQAGTTAPGQRKRIRAVDMFADSDDSDGTAK